MTPIPVVLPPGCPPLNSYYFYLTAGCNLACRHCWLAPKFQPNGGTGGHLDYSLFELAIMQGLPLGLSHAKLTGGEPLLHPDFMRMVEFLKIHNIGVTIETNATLMDKSTARFLKETGNLSFITVSLDGAAPETHDAFRGVKGSHEKAIQGISNLVEVGYHPQVIMSLHKENINEIEPLVQLVQRLGASSVKLGIIQSSGRGELMTDREQVIDFEELFSLGDWIENDLQPKSSIPVYFNWPMAFYSIKKLLNFSGYSCNIYNILGIISTGHMAMCGIGTLVPELCYGLLGKDSVADVWINNSILNDLRGLIPGKLEGICGECILKNRCLGACTAQNYHISNSIVSPYWFCKQANEMGLFPQSRRR